MRVIIQAEALRRSEGHHYHHFIHELPTIDAVEVVRCKDCKKRGTSYACPFRHLMFTEAEGYHYVDCTTDYGYCSFGVRKEADHGSD